MIISHRYKYIFLKTNKTAGTSIEIALSKYCGPKDIITPIAPEDEEIRSKLGYRGSQNYQNTWGHYQLRDWIQLPSQGKRKDPYFNHVGAKEVRKNIGARVWNSYFKFCFERNPWDRMISHYHYRWGGRNKEDWPPLSQHIESHSQILKERGCGIYTIDGGVAVDKICRFESIEEELESIRLRLHMPKKLELPRAKSQYRKDKRHYREIFGEAERQKVAELFSYETALLGYEF
ncbi:MAG: sulfotransferase family 2 domain-containing protein [Pirellulaceae bacterium]|nr:sulfotransferase family 2 domain-containing protein [Pirellulaceae bacterium]